MGITLITPGSSLGFVIAFLSAFDRGDQVAIATPGYQLITIFCLRYQTIFGSARAEQGG